MPKVHSYRMCAKQNMTVDRTAEFLGVERRDVLSVAKRFNIFFVGTDPVPLAWQKQPKQQPEPQINHEAKARRMRLVGHSVTAIADTLGIPSKDVQKLICEAV